MSAFSNDASPCAIDAPASRLPYKRLRRATTMQRVLGLLAQSEVNAEEIDELVRLAETLEDRAGVIERLGARMRQEADDLRDLAVVLSSKVISVRNEQRRRAVGPADGRGADHGDGRSLADA